MLPERRTCVKQSLETQANGPALTARIDAGPAARPANRQSEMSRAAILASLADKLHLQNNNPLTLG
jgi:hypothetical protein